MLASIVAPSVIPATVAARAGLPGRGFNASSNRPTESGTIGPAVKTSHRIRSGASENLVVEGKLLNQLGLAGQAETA